MPPRGKATNGRRQHTRPGLRTPSAPAATMLSGFNSLPQELVDLIVDNIDDDIPSLEACALTSRAFLASSRRYQFFGIELTGLLPSHHGETRAQKQKQTLCDKFYALITHSPHIAPLVRDLSILEGGVAWLANRRSPLPLVLRQLVNLEHISLGEGNQVIKWTNLPHRVRESLLDIFRSPQTQSVTLLLIDELPHPAKLFPVREGSSLNDIIMLGVTLEEEIQNFNNADLPTPSFPLGTLELAIFEQRLVVLQDYFEPMLASLWSLKLILADVEDLASAWYFIERSTALDELSISISWCNLHDIASISEGRFPTLKAHSDLQSIVFEMSLIGLHGDDYWHDPLAWIIDVLNTLSPSAAPQEVLLALEVSFHNHARPFQPAAWSRLDALLTSADWVRGPCQLAIDIIPTTCPAGGPKIEVYQIIRRAILMSLPRLCAKKLVVVESKFFDEGDDVENDA